MFIQNCFKSRFLLLFFVSFIFALGSIASFQVYAAGKETHPVNEKGLFVRENCHSSSQISQSQLPRRQVKGLLRKVKKEDLSATEKKKYKKRALPLLKQHDSNHLARASQQKRSGVLTQQKQKLSDSEHKMNERDLKKICKKLGITRREIRNHSRRALEL